MRRLPFDPAGAPFIAAAAAAAVLSRVALGWIAAGPFVALAGFFLFFFRDPERRASDGADLVLAPADGRVLVAGRALAESAPPGEWQQVSIFLSPMDEHINRVPISGIITNVTYTPGRFLPAYRHDAGGANERSEIWIDHGGQTIIARQVVGILARRVVCRLSQGARVSAGDRYGLMKFGSRMDVFVPISAELRVTVGTRVRGGETVIAVLH